jgi:hypothetical protein
MATQPAIELQRTSQRLLNIKFAPRASKQFGRIFAPRGNFFAAKFASYQSVKH